MPSNNQAIISVILPVFNGEDHLAECIESVLYQSYTNFEFIIVDDASTDSTPQILEKYSNQDERIRVITNTVNQKQTVSANTACKNSVGKYIARMDADDIALPKRFEKQFEFLEANPDVGMVGSWTDTISDSGKVIGQWKTSAEPNVLIWDLLFGASFAHSSVMMRKDSIVHVGFYQLYQAEDYDLWSRISRITKVANIPEILQQKRVWGGQLALKVISKNHDCTLQVMQNNMQLLLNNSSIDLELVKAIHSVIEKNQIELDSNTLVKTTYLINVLYDTYISKTNLSKAEEKKVTVDVFQILYQLANWQFSANIYKALGEILYLAYRFPKLFIHSLIHRKN